MNIELEHIGGNKPWVAKITGTDPKFGLAREFVRGVLDYSRKNKPGTRGIFTCYDLQPGVYETKGGDSWGSANNRRFIQIEASNLSTYKVLDMQQVLEIVKAKQTETNEVDYAI